MAEGNAQFSAGETKLIVEVVKNLKGSWKPDTDWNKVAEAMGYKDAGIAKTRLGQICRKWAKSSDDAADDGSPAKNSPSLSTPRKRKTADNTTTPSKSPKKAKKGKDQDNKNAADDSNNDVPEDDDAEAMVKKEEDEDEGT